MKIGEQYVGLGLGDVSPEVGKVKALLKRKFTPARNTLDDGDLFTPELAVEVLRVQNVYRGEKKPGAAFYVDSVINLEFKYDVGLLKRPPGPDTRGVLLTVCGTGVPWWVGPDADVARAVESKYLWRPVGYPAAPVPMGRSINDGVNEAIRIVEEERSRIEKYGLNLGGYSQGAYVIAVLWETHIRPEGGRLHWAAKHMRKAFAIGNPKREKGKVWPDFGGSPMAGPDTMGVDENNMVNTPDWWRNYAHAGDLYAASVDDESIENKRAVWKVIRGTKVFSGPDSLLAQVLEVLGVKRDASQLAEAYGIFKAVWDAGMFFAKGTGPHVDYGIGPAIDYLMEP